MEKSEDVEKTVQSALQETVNSAFRDGHPQDRVGVEINHPALDHPINIGFTTQEKITPEKIREDDRSRATGLDFSQRFTELDFDDDLDVQFTRIRLPRGGQVFSGL